ncbi:MAG TPA: DUF397 domain-containing protein [Pilimelia sp.]|nr:DUF397 domain-containing protein [Pilimelia sp.]
MAMTPASAWTWRKSTRCESAMCVEVAALDGAMAVRDSADPGPQLRFAAENWRTFLDGLRSGALAGPVGGDAVPRG